MGGEDGLVEVRLIGAPDTSDARTHLLAVGLSPAAVVEVTRGRVQRREPVLLGQLFGNDHDDNAEHLLRCLRELQASGAEFELLFEGEAASVDDLLNALGQWRQIRAQVKRQDERRHGPG
jgi:hypothetical protein